MIKGVMPSCADRSLANSVKWEMSFSKMTMILIVQWRGLIVFNWPKIAFTFVLQHPNSSDEKIALYCKHSNTEIHRRGGVESENVVGNAYRDGSRMMLRVSKLKRGKKWRHSDVSSILFFVSAFSVFSAHSFQMFGWPFSPQMFFLKFRSIKDIIIQC